MTQKFNLNINLMIKFNIGPSYSRTNGLHARTFSYSYYKVLYFFQMKAYYYKCATISLPHQIQQTHLTSDNCPKLRCPL